MSLILTSVILVEKPSGNIRQPTNIDVKRPSVNSKSIFLVPTDSLEIEKILNKLEPKSGGVANINVKT